MNAPTAPVRQAARNAAVPVAPIRRAPRSRDYGIGYGNSSGYAGGRRYASNGFTARFRFA